MRMPGAAQTAERVWSEQQHAIFNEFLVGKRHVVVRARAGCAKTTTALKAVECAPERRILMAAFNKQIANELQARVQNAHVQVSTLHALGFKYVRMKWEGVRVGDNRKWDIVDQVINRHSTPDVVRGALARLHTQVRELNPWASEVKDVEGIAEAFDLHPNEDVLEFLSEEAFYQKVLECLEAATEETDEIDFSDMIFLPLKLGLIFPQYDLVVIDEAQDMTSPQLQMGLRACHQGGRVVIIGDDRQAIYGFRGASSGGIDRLKEQLQAWEYGLTTTYRCAQTIVERAKELVPDFEAAPGAEAGVVRQVMPGGMYMVASEGDFVLSRTNAPLMGVCLTLIRQGKRARIRGRDIGKGLIDLVTKLKATTLPALTEALHNWASRETMRVVKKGIKGKLDHILDAVETLETLMEAPQVTSVAALKAELMRLFDDSVGAAVIMCSTVHKAKGLEADRVFVLEDTLKRGSVEEDNIRYVAYTRAKRELVLVSERSDDNMAARIMAENPPPSPGNEVEP